MSTLHRTSSFFFCNPLKVLALALAILGVPAAASAAKPSRCPAGSQPVPRSPRCVMPVTTTISSVDSNGLPADIASDGLGSYSNGVSGVTSFLTDNGYNGIAFGDWQFDTYASTSRFVNHSLDPEDAVQPGDPHYTAPANPPFWGALTLTSRVTVKCTLVYNNMLAMTAGSSFTCPLINKFNYAASTTGSTPLTPSTAFRRSPTFRSVATPRTPSAATTGSWTQSTSARQSGGSSRPRIRASTMATFI